MPSDGLQSVSLKHLQKAIGLKCQKHGFYFEMETSDAGGGVARGGGVVVGAGVSGGGVGARKGGGGDGKGGGGARGEGGAR